QRLGCSRLPVGLRYTGVVECSSDYAPDRLPRRKPRILGNISDPDPAAADDLARIRLADSRQDLQQSRFPRSIGPDDAQPVPFLDTEQYVLEERRRSVRLGDCLGTE